MIPLRLWNKRHPGQRTHEGPGPGTSTKSIWCFSLSGFNSASVPGPDLAPWNWHPNSLPQLPHKFWVSLWPPVTYFMFRFFCHLRMSPSLHYSFSSKGLESWVWILGGEAYCLWLIKDLSGGWKTGRRQRRLTNSNIYLCPDPRIFHGLSVQVLFAFLAHHWQ